MIGGTGRLTFREWHNLAGWLRMQAILLALGAAFGWIGPFGTFNGLGAVDRYAYWMLILPLVGIPARLAIMGVMRIDAFASWPAAAKAGLASVVAAFPGSFLVIGLGTLFQMFPVLSPGLIGFLYCSVGLMMFLIALPFLLISEHRQAALAALPSPLPGAPVASRPAPSPFLQRVPEKLGSDLRYIATEDHYLRVHTALGNDLVLFRLSDAIAELAPELGLQVHRSYWVARDAIASVERDGHRTWLVLTDGARIPVARSYLPALRMAGWL